MRWVTSSGLAAAVVAGLFGLGTAAAQPVPGPLPVPYNPPAAQAKALDANTPPPGANIAGCKSGAHPNPVILVNGMYLTQGSTWASGAPQLSNNGYCVFTFNYGNPLPVSGFPVQQVTDMRASGRELAAHIDKVRAQTGAAQVDLVGYSQGGVLAQYYVNVLGGAAKVGKIITIVGENHGMAQSPVTAPADQLLPPIIQLRKGSDFINEIYRNGDTRPGVKYTVITSSTDPIVAPHQETFLRGATNIVLQDGCAADRTDHNAAPHSRRVWWHVLNALHPASASPVPCFPVAPAG